MGVEPIRPKSRDFKSRASTVPPPRQCARGAARRSCRRGSLWTKTLTPTLSHGEREKSEPCWRVGPEDPSPCPPRRERRRRPLTLTLSPRRGERAASPQTSWRPTQLLSPRSGRRRRPLTLTFSPRRGIKKDAGLTSLTPRTGALPQGRGRKSGASTGRPLTLPSPPGEGLRRRPLTLPLTPHTVALPQAREKTKTPHPDPFPPGEGKERHPRRPVGAPHSCSPTGDLCVTTVCATEEVRSASNGGQPLGQRPGVGGSRGVPAAFRRRGGTRIPRQPPARAGRRAARRRLYARHLNHSSTAFRASPRYRTVR